MQIFRTGAQMTDHNQYDWAPAFMVAAGLLAVGFAAHSLVQTHKHNKMAEANICRNFAQAATVTPYIAQLAPDFCAGHPQFVLTKR